MANNDDDSEDDADDSDDETSLTNLSIYLSNGFVPPAIDKLNIKLSFGKNQQ